jgi:hypothetical protein
MPSAPSLLKPLLGLADGLALVFALGFVVDGSIRQPAPHRIEHHVQQSDDGGELVVIEHDGGPGVQPG